MPVIFVDRYPKALCDSRESLPVSVTECPRVPLEELYETVKGLGLAVPELDPTCARMRILQIGTKEPVFYLVNEGDSVYQGKVILPAEGSCYGYDAWQNRCVQAESVPVSGGTQVSLYVEPQKSLMLVFGECDFELEEPLQAQGTEILTGKWVLEIEDAAEGVEVFVDGRSAGIQIAAPYLYDLTEFVHEGCHELAVEVATTLERECYPMLEGFQKLMAPEPSALSGITGSVRLWRQ